jgi:hypothetical protein
MTKELQTIREALEHARAWTENVGVELRCGKALAALDTLSAEPSEDARELATRLFEGVAKRVDQFFKAKNIQGGVRCGDDMFSAIDKLELAKSIERYAAARDERVSQKVREECGEEYRTAIRKIIAHTGLLRNPSNELLIGLINSIKRIASDAITGKG